VRPSDIIRAYIGHENANRFGHMMKYLANEKRAYKLVDDEELQSITKADHHEGICLLIRRRRPLLISEYIAQAANKEIDCVVGLAEVNNPHNIGSILRVCAFFGVDAVYTERGYSLESGAACRNAEGGSEHLEFVTGSPLDETIKAFSEAGYAIAATTGHAGTDLAQAEEIPTKLLLLLGSERDGLPKDVIENADLKLRIPGSGMVESLNVACAASVLLSNLFHYESEEEEAETEAHVEAEANEETEAHVEAETHEKAEAETEEVEVDSSEASSDQEALAEGESKTQDGASQTGHRYNASEFSEEE